MQRVRGFGGRAVLLPVVVLGALALAGCGGGITTAGGGTGGTGISTGTVTAVGSVHIYEARFTTDNALKMINGMDNSAGKDTDVFRVGMVVTVRYDASDNNATEVDYEDNLEGPIGSKNPADNTVTVLGQQVVVDNAALFASLAVGNEVEVSGFADNAGRIRETLVDVKHGMMAVYEIKGFVREYSPADNTFRLSPLRTGPGTTATFSASGASLVDLTALDNGVFVEVKVAAANSGLAQIPAGVIEKMTHRTDLPEGVTVTIEGLVTRVASRAGTTVSFDLEGKPMQFTGGAAANIQPNARLQATGTISNGTLSASRIVFR